MKIVDANVVLRYLLDDHPEQSDMANHLIENENILIPYEVIAEIVYVLQKVYKVDRSTISEILLDLFEYDNFIINNKEIVKEALSLFSSRSIDFVDSLLYGYKKVESYEIVTFDKKLNKLLESLN